MRSENMILCEAEIPIWKQTMAHSFFKHHCYEITILSQLSQLVFHFYLFNKAVLNSVWDKMLISSFTSLWKLLVQAAAMLSKQWAQAKLRFRKHFSKMSAHFGCALFLLILSHKSSYLNETQGPLNTDPPQLLFIKFWSFSHRTRQPVCGQETLMSTGCHFSLTRC